MLTQTTKELLQNSKNLLAFSGGIDSTALLFILQEEGIEFDIAIVDYGLRKQSKEEVAYAKELAAEFGFCCHVKKAPPINENFEAKARVFRYDFFETLIEKYNYTTLLTAHHLGDRLEWFLMQLCKGAGCIELAGMQERELREHYTLLRPLLTYTKEDLLAYLHKHKKKYFVDASNHELKYKRNRFRQTYATPLLKEYKEGIAKSFAYIDADRANLTQEQEYLQKNKLICFTKSRPRNELYHIDKIFKAEFGIVLSAPLREHYQEHRWLIAARKYLVTTVDNYIIIAPFLKNRPMEKKFKEQMRKAGIDPKLRPYLFEDPEALAFLSLLLA